MPRNSPVWIVADSHASGQAIAVELYREGKLSLRMMGELTGVGSDYWAAENFRVRHKVPLNYSSEDLEADRAAADKLLKPSV